MDEFDDITILSEEYLESLLSDAYVQMEHTRAIKHPLGEDHVDLIRFKKYFAEYERRHPPPPRCWWGMRSKYGYPATMKNAYWVPWLCGRVTDLPLDPWVRLINEWTDKLGWRVIDLHHPGPTGAENLRKALVCHLETKGQHNFSTYASLDMAKCFNNPFGNDLYSHCTTCPACIRRTTVNEDTSSRLRHIEEVSLGFIRHILSKVGISK